MLPQEIKPYPVVVIDDIWFTIEKKGAMYRFLDELVRLAHDQKVIVFFVTQEILPVCALNKGFKVKPLPCCKKLVERIRMQLDTKLTDWPIWERCVESQLLKENINSFHGVFKVTPNFRI